MASCLSCGGSFADHKAKLCISCDKGKCLKCGGSFADRMAKLCSSCNKGKCISCGSTFADRMAKLCSSCDRRPSDNYPESIKAVETCDYAEDIDGRGKQLHLSQSRLRGRAMP